MRRRNTLLFPMLLVARVASAQYSIDTRDPRADMVAWLRNGGTAGQAFVAQSNGAMLTASLWLGSDNPNPINFRAYLQQWSGAPEPTTNTQNHVIGPVLYASSVQTVSGDLDPGTRFDFDLAGVPLSAGQRYIFYAAMLAYDPNGDLSSFYTRSNDYYGGNAVHSNSNQLLPLYEGDSYDAAFVATFGASMEDPPPVTTIPEPGSQSLVGIALFFLVALKARVAKARDAHSE